MLNLTKYIVRFADGRTLPVDAVSREHASAKAYRIELALPIASIEPAT